MSQQRRTSDVLNLNREPRIMFMHRYHESKVMPDPVMCAKTTNHCASEHERYIIWSDPRIGIRWPIDGEPVLFAKDRQGVTFDRAEYSE